MPQIFISYSHDDRYLAERLAQDLIRDCYEAWIDVDGLIGGDVWQKAIESAIQRAHALLVVVTQGAIDSEWVGREIGIAKEKGTRIVPLVMTRFDDLWKALDRLGLADLQAIDFVALGSERGYAKLLKALPPAPPCGQPQRGIAPPSIQQTVIGSSHVTQIGTVEKYIAAETVDRADIDSLHRAYLAHWFGQPWATVPLADIANRSERVSLLDVYVPLPVDFAIVAKTEKGKIVDWWAQQDEEASKDKLPRGLEPEVDEAQRRMKIRQWAALGVAEAGLQQIVDGVQTRLDGRGESNDREINWYMEAHDAASVQPRMVLVGDPGSGKSSFVRHLTLCMAGEQLRALGETGVPDNASLAALRDWLLGAYTPVYIELRDLVTQAFPPLPEDGASPKFPTVDDFWRYVQSRVLGETLAGYGPELLRRLSAASGEAILLLDGLDEVPDAADDRRRQQVQALIASLVERFSHTRVIVTSRPHAYRVGQWALPGFGRATLRPLYPSRLQELAEALFRVLMPDRAEAESEAFFEALKKVPEDLQRSPLFFTLLAAIWLETPEHDLPQARGALYRRGLDLMLARWTERKGYSLPTASLLNLNGPELRQVLEGVACQVHGLGEAGGDTTEFHRRVLSQAVEDFSEGEVPPAQVWKHLEQRAGILVSGRPEHFRFVHRSFQEHLAACYLSCPEPQRRRPPIAAEDRFANGLAKRVLGKPDLWGNVALLAADELKTSGRHESLWRLLAELVRPLLKEGRTEERAQAAMLALKMAAEQDLIHAGWDEYSPEAGILKGLQAASLSLITDLALPPEQRAEAGRMLGLLGDSRPGVLAPGGMPEIVWCEVPGGPFKMGGDPDAWGAWAGAEFDLGYPFWIAKYPVTYAQYEAFVSAGGYENDACWTPDGLEWRGKKRQPEAYWNDPKWHIPNHPVVGVTWYEAYAFAQWLNNQPGVRPANVPAGYVIRLARECEWEKAARYPDGRFFPWGNEWDPARLNSSEGGIGRTNAVGIFPNGANPAHGAHDLCGNVWEWCLTQWQTEYQSPDKEGNDPGDRALRVLRGGSWGDSQGNARAASRDRLSPVSRYDDGGYRVVCASPI